MESQGMRIVLFNPNTSRDTITTPESLEISAGAVCQMADQITADVSGVIVAAFGDPGLETIRDTLSCPVCGIGEASFFEAAEGGRKFAVVTTTGALVDSIAERVAAAGCREQFLGTYVMVGDPLTLMRDAERLTDGLGNETAVAISAGAEAVIIGGGPLANAAQKLRARVPVEIIEPVPAAARLIRRNIESEARR